MVIRPAAGGIFFLHLLVLVRLGNSDFRGFWVSKSKKNRLLKSGYSAPNLLKSRYSRFEAIAQVGGSMFFGDWLKSKNHRKFLRLKPYALMSPASGELLAGLKVDFYEG